MFIFCSAVFHVHVADFTGLISLFPDLCDSPDLACHKGPIIINQHTWRKILVSCLCWISISQPTVDTACHSLFLPDPLWLPSYPFSWGSMAGMFHQLSLQWECQCSWRYPTEYFCYVCFRVIPTLCYFLWQQRGSLRIDWCVKPQRYSAAVKIGK